MIFLVSDLYGIPFIGLTVVTLKGNTQQWPSRWPGDKGPAIYCPMLPQRGHFDVKAKDTSKTESLFWSTSPSS